VTVESLYPFLYGGEGGDEEVLRQAIESTAAKAEEITALRKQIVEDCGTELERCAAAMAGRFAAGGRLFTFGNGGSSTDAHAIARLFTSPPRGRALPAACLTDDVAIITALANDVGFDVVFARQLAALARAGDIALGVSTSGASKNVLRAFAEGRRARLLTVGVAGYDGGAMGEGDTIDHLFVVPSSSVHRIQEAQTTVYHVLWALTQEALASS
jgi:D-sedoheptulose 7-phosphate isomerase